ncbi:MAG: hypothetical protein K2I72_02815 [Bacilli bacterium]|nr:hypothetical protein [Bacilli bacterium]
MIKNEVAKVARILTQYEGYCHTIIEKYEGGLGSELVKIPVFEEEFEIKVGTVFRCTKVDPLLLEEVRDEDVLSFEQFIEITQDLDSVPYDKLIEIFEGLKGKVGLFCGDYPDCSMKFLIRILAHYDSADDSHDVSSTIKEFLKSKTVSDSLKEEVRGIFEEIYDSERLNEFLPKNKDFKDFTKSEFYQLNFHLCKLESGQKISKLLFRLEKYFDFPWKKEEENQKGHEKKIGEIKQS